jgi:hypothetical protein
MGAVENHVGRRTSAREALLQAAIATGHEEPPRLFVSDLATINAALVGRPETASWMVVATEGFLLLSPGEQTVAYANLIERRANRLVSWPLANMVLLLLSLILAMVGIIGPVLVGYISPIQPSPAAVLARQGSSILLAILAIGIFSFVENRILLLSDENALFRTKDPEHAVSGLVKAALAGSKVPGCENYWHYLFWRMPQGIDGASVNARIAMLEAVTGPAALGVRERVLRGNSRRRSR